MGKENEVFFTKRNTFRTVMSFEVLTVDDSFTEDIEISCAEDLEEVMKLYVKKDWKALFYEYNERNAAWYKEVTDARLEGLHSVSRDQEIGTGSYRLTSEAQMYLGFNPEVLGDRNAEKIAKIREIIGK